MISQHLEFKVKIQNDPNKQIATTTENSVPWSDLNFPKVWRNRPALDCHVFVPSQNPWFCGVWRYAHDQYTNPLARPLPTALQVVRTSLDFIEENVWKVSSTHPRVSLPCDKRLTLYSPWSSLPSFSLMFITPLNFKCRTSTGYF